MGYPYLKRDYMTKLYIIDVEASGLNPMSYPIEIAWLSLDGESHDSFLINPQTAHDWTYWCGIAESEFHNISRDELIENGIDVRVAAERLNESLRGSIVISDAAGHDEFWISELIEEAGLQLNFQIVDVRDYVISCDIPTERYIAFLNEMSKERAQHRALEDCKKIRDAGVLAELWN